MLSFHDEEQRHLCDPPGDQANVHHLGSEWRDIVLQLQVTNVLSVQVHFMHSTLVVWHDVPLHLLETFDKVNRYALKK